jgi:glycosyltransferase involved in cell wall biosynthesis
MPPGAVARSQPGISVVVLAHAHSGRLERCLHSLAEQTLERQLFEVITVLDGDAQRCDDLVEEFRNAYPDLTLRCLRLTVRGQAEAQNAGAAAASRQFTTFVDADDHVSARFLEVLHSYAGPTVVPVVPVRAAGPTGIVNEPADLLTDNRGKAVATDLIRDIGYDPSLEGGAAELLWTTAVVRHDITFHRCPASADAVYYRGVDGTPTDVTVESAVELASRLDALTAEANAASIQLLRERLVAQASVINRHLTRSPADHGRVVDLLDRYAITHLPYDRMNAGLSRRLVIAYAFPPYADASAIVTAKRVRTHGEVVDVVSNSMGRIREIDASLRRISGPFVGHHAALATPTYFSDWGSIERFALEGLDVIQRWEESHGQYPSVFSRAQFAASHFLAAAYKLSRPDVHWVAEFSDPLSHDVQDAERGTLVRRGAFLRRLRKGMRNLGLSVPRSRNCFIWCEELTYALADQLVFTNENQMEYMLGYCSDPSLAHTARRKALIDPHPTLPARFYTMVERDYSLEPGRTHLAYFGNFYATRGLDDVLTAIANADREIRDGVRLHVFTPTPEDLERRAGELGISKNVSVGPYVRYLEFLNLATKFDCLIVNDAVTAASHPRNPYLPSKWSDYRGSGTPVWGLVERGSPLSEHALDYVSPVGDVASAIGILARLISRGVGREPVRPGALAGRS